MSPLMTRGRDKQQQGRHIQASEPVNEKPKISDVTEQQVTIDGSH